MTRPPFGFALLVCCLLAAAAVGPRRAQADDSSTGVMLPGLAGLPPGSVRVAETTVDLRDGLVHEALTLEHTGPADVAAGIDGPPFAWRGEADPYPDRQFPELRATVDGIEASPGDAFAAFVGKQDITALISLAGLDPFTIGDSPPIVDRLDGAGRTAFDTLQKLGAVTLSKGQFLAHWTARRIFRFSLGRNAQSVLTLTYRARPGFALMAFRDLPRAIHLKDYCVTQAILAERLGAPKQDRLLLVKTFAIPVGIDGKPPERVMARVASPDAIFCGHGGSPLSGGSVPSSRPASTGVGGILHVIEIGPPG